MELLGDVGHVESRSVRLKMEFVFVQGRCTVCAKRTKWKLVLVCLEIVLILTQDRCTVCAKRTVGSDIVLDAPYRTPR